MWLTVLTLANLNRQPIQRGGSGLGFESASEVLLLINKLGLCLGWKGQCICWREGREGGGERVGRGQRDGGEGMWGREVGEGSRRGGGREG